MLITEQTITDTEHLAELQRTFAFIRDNGLLGRVCNIGPSQYGFKTKLHLNDLSDLERIVGSRLPGARHGNWLQYSATVKGFELGCCVRVQEEGE